MYLHIPDLNPTSPNKRLCVRVGVFGGLFKAFWLRLDYSRVKVFLKILSACYVLQVDAQYPVGCVK